MQMIWGQIANFCCKRKFLRGRGWGLVMDQEERGMSLRGFSGPHLCAVGPCYEVLFKYNLGRKTNIKGALIPICLREI